MNQAEKYREAIKGLIDLYRGEENVPKEVQAAINYLDYRAGNWELDHPKVKCETCEGSGEAGDFGMRYTCHCCGGAGKVRK
ncbi:MAG: hypothetical protein Q8P59_13110 [Dehalococcoidia bacterium]|nr:hypothetical protein [Dehalococcoidia bacterium]